MLENMWHFQLLKNDVPCRNQEKAILGYAFMMPFPIKQTLFLYQKLYPTPTYG